jgi:hypothetical protein
VKRRTTALTLIGALLAGLAVTAGTGAAGAQRAEAVAEDSTVWLCRPGLPDNPCTADRTATAVNADGDGRTEKSRRAKSRPIDCFYIYPTVSAQPTINANLNIDPIQIDVANAQASRFSKVCRVYAPIYRQLTLSAIGGGATAEAAAIAYGDVRQAWNDYLTHYNRGRGVVLIGHSQGAGMLNQLVREKIDPKPKARRRLASALLLGGNVLVPRGQDVGGDFANIRACRSANQTHCVVAYSTFNAPPPPDAIFGRVNEGFNRVRGVTPSPEESEILCVNPGALARQAESTAHAYYPTHLDLGVLGTALPADALAPIPTPWVSYPGLYRAQCREADGASWLNIEEVGEPGDPRPALVNSLGPGWGLHLVDVNVVLGDLVSLVRRQGAAWAREQSGS